MSNYKITNITENNDFSSDDKFEKQYELTFELPDKTDKIQLSGNGAVKVTVSV